MTEPARLDVEDVWRDVGESLRGFIRMHVSDADAADDVFGDVMLRIHQHLGELDEHERVTAWVFRIARNAVTDHYRRAGRRHETLDHDWEAVAGAPGADAWLDDQGTVYEELAACIRPLVDALPVEYRRALELTDLERRTQAEAARLEGISVSGMKSRVQRGRRQLAILLAQCCHVMTDAGGRPLDVTRLDGSCGCAAGAAQS